MQCLGLPDKASTICDVSLSAIRPFVAMTRDNVRNWSCECTRCHIDSGNPEICACHILIVLLDLVLRICACTSI